jgi:hypothetical protein
MPDLLQTSMHYSGMPLFTRTTFQAVTFKRAAMLPDATPSCRCMSYSMYLG